MNIIVCVKQVPDTTEVKMNPETNTIIREGVESVVNPFDAFAIEEGLKIKDVYGGKVTALSMGIPDAVQMLKEILALGVDDAVLLSDRKFAGADSLATAYALSLGVKKINDFDLIICGKQATDGDTAQVGPSLAEKLGISHCTYVSHIEEIGSDYIRVKKLVDDGYEIIELSLPAVITVEKGINRPRIPSIKHFKNALEKEVLIWTTADVAADSQLIGLSGSPTQVVRTFIPQYNKEIQILEGTPDQQAKDLMEKLAAENFLGCE